jgi:uncharacterized protein YukE
MTAQPWEAGLARLEGAYAQVADRLNSIDARFGQMDARTARRRALCADRYAFRTG